MEKKGVFDLKMKTKLLSSFQHVVVETIIKTVLEAKNKLGINRVVCGGGVIANNYLRQRLEQEKAKGMELFVSPRQFSGDNAAMVAGLGFYLYNIKKTKKSIRSRI